jgi:hypothetical protein
VYIKSKKISDLPACENLGVGSGSGSGSKWKVGSGWYKNDAVPQHWPQVPVYYYRARDVENWENNLGKEDK